MHPDTPLSPKQRRADSPKDNPEQDPWRIDMGGEDPEPMTESEAFFAADMQLDQDRFERVFGRFE